MNRHLSPEESVAALDHTLVPAREAHLETCDACRRELADMRAALDDVGSAADIAEPSPLFWDHLSARVRQTTDAENAPKSMWAWPRLWRPVAGLAAVGLLAIWFVARDPASEPGSPRADVALSADPTAATDVLADAPWDAVVEMATVLSVDDVNRAVPFGIDTVVLFDELTPEEREAFVRLLKTEMDGVE